MTAISTVERQTGGGAWLAEASVAGPARLLTIQDAARLTQVSADTIRRLIHLGRLRASNYATGEERAKWRIDPADLARVESPRPDVPAPQQRESPTPPPRRQRRRQPESVSGKIQVW